jgi:hypothetical protein
MSSVMMKLRTIPTSRTCRPIGRCYSKCMHGPGLIGGILQQPHIFCVRSSIRTIPFLKICTYARTCTHGYAMVRAYARTYVRCEMARNATMPVARHDSAGAVVSSSGVYTHVLGPAGDGCRICVRARFYILPRIFAYGLHKK